MDIILSYLLQHICDLMSLANLTELPHRIDKFLWAFRQKKTISQKDIFLTENTIIGWHSKTYDTSLEMI